MSNVIEHKKINTKLVQRLENRDVALWIADWSDDSPDAQRLLADIALLPWRQVMIESTSETFASYFDAQDTEGYLTEARGYPYPINIDPKDILLPRKCLPVYFLNGVDNADGPSSSKLGRFASQTRRLNQLNTLIQTPPTEIVLLSDSETDSILDLREMWSEGFRALVSVFSTHDSVRELMERWLDSAQSPAAIDFYQIPLFEIKNDLYELLGQTFSETKKVVKMKTGKSSYRTCDISSCELTESPLLDRYELLQASQLVLIQPDELVFEELSSFFDRKSFSWKPFAAGLPWYPDQSHLKMALSSLNQIEQNGVRENKILSICSQPGAGGTTLAHYLAFNLAREGYPALIAKDFTFRPSPTEIESFLLRVRKVVVAEDATLPETPWVIVFDSVHWAGRASELRTFVNLLTQRGRPVIVIVVNSPESDEDFESNARTQSIAELQHEISRDQAVGLGVHLNRFLERHGKTQSSSEWEQFWEQHRPRLETPLSSFWIALEFWLRGLLNIEDSIQNMLYEQFSKIEASDDFKRLLLEIAALTVERQPLPEGLMPRDHEIRSPYSVLLEEARIDAPALGLVRESFGVQNQWALVHTQIGRYLLNSFYHDRKMCEQLGFGHAENATHLRLLLLQRLITRPELAIPAYKELAADFAVRILKLDTGQAEEFFPLWREVFRVLNSVPSNLRNTRTFLHHIAISCRRVAVSKNYFNTTLDEDEELLSSAIQHIEFALELPKQESDEADLNLWNSLSLAYQNLADVFNKNGKDPMEIEKLRSKATEATLRAQREDPQNPYVLETTARNLVQGASFKDNDKVKDLVLALGYVYDAIQNERSNGRHYKLNSLFKQTIQLLTASEQNDELNDLCRSEKSIGWIAKAWILIARSFEMGDMYALTDVSPSIAQQALDILSNATGSRDWMLIKFEYDLISIASPDKFEDQLALIEELEGTSYQLSFQLQLEHAVLLYQVGRAESGSNSFKYLRRLWKKHDAFVEVPDRMKWLLTSDRSEHQRREAIVFETSEYNHRAKIKGFGNNSVPYLPQDFGEKYMPIGQKFNVEILFGRMGPRAKPLLHRKN